MKTLEQLRDVKATKYAEACDNESGAFLSHQLEAIRAKAHKAGFSDGAQAVMDEAQRVVDSFATYADMHNRSCAIVEYGVCSCELEKVWAARSRWQAFVKKGGE